MPPKRAAASDTAATSKKFRSAIDESIAEFICPITQELPLDPVTAEDGLVYEREAIERWLTQKRTSPSTNKAMGTRLLPAVQARSVIEKLVKSGAIAGDKAENWQKRIQDEEEFLEKKRRAEGGDAGAMNTVGTRYASGKGVKKDEALAKMWYERAAQNGHLRAQTNLACRLFNSNEEDSNEFRGGLMHLTEAACRGDAWACNILASMYAHGSHLPKDEALAERWYKKALNCTGALAADPEERTEASAWLSNQGRVDNPWKC